VDYVGEVGNVGFVTIGGGEVDAFWTSVWFTAKVDGAGDVCEGVATSAVVSYEDVVVGAAVVVVVGIRVV
jgi:hypothetical protein